MMLDIKNEQKWPLAEKVRKSKSVKGHFFFVSYPGMKKGRLPKPPQHIQHTTSENQCQHFFYENDSFGWLHQLKGNFLDDFPTCKTGTPVLFFKYKRSFLQRGSIQTMAFQFIFRLYKYLYHKQNECAGGVQISSEERVIWFRRIGGNQWC